MKRIHNDKKQRLLLVTDFFYPHWTGIAKALSYFIEGVGDSIDITVLTTRYSRSLPAKEVYENATIFRTGYLFPLSRSKYSVQIIWKFLQLVGMYDVVMINSPFTNILPIAILTKLFRKKLVVFHQGDLNLPKGMTNRLIEKIFDISTFVSLQYADTVSTYTADYAENSRVLRPFLKKFHPMMMPFTPPSKTTTVIEEIEQAKREKKQIFGFAGRFVEEKGFDILFKAIPAIRKTLPNAQFFFAGETEIAYEEFYKTQQPGLLKMKAYVTILGLLKAEKLAAFYNALDFLLIPSRSDCFPLVQAEAVLSGVPIVVADIPGARDVVNKTAFGMIFAKEDAEDLAKKVILAVRERENIMKHKKDARNYFDYQNHVRNIKRIITS